MKNNTFLLLLPAFVLAMLLGMTACQKDSKDAADATASAAEDRNNPNSAVYPITANVNGKSYAEWTAEWWRWVAGIPCATNPINDPTGANGGINQSGPVYFLAGTGGGTATRNITIPHGKKILFPIINLLIDYPCPDPDYGPAPGQTVEEFLTQSASELMNLAGGLEVTLDGVALNNEADYRVPSGMFYFTGDPDLVNCFDPCITGEEQPGASDGYWMILKPLSKGQHTLNFKASVPAFGFSLDVTYNITIP